VISCNAFVDLYVGVPVTISAKNNSWDHVPPALACSGGDDICDPSGTAVIDFSNATLAPSPCL